MMCFCAITAGILRIFACQRVGSSGETLAKIPAAAKRKLDSRKKVSAAAAQKKGKKKTGKNCLIEQLSRPLGRQPFPSSKAQKTNLRC
jgi:hypothetical protein